ncbi:CD109 antigen isoform X2 [Nematostella vectensis]|nr:CD109 antigen isoform X2 [Nematostella vectensis]
MLKMYALRVSIVVFVGLLGNIHTTKASASKENNTYIILAPNQFRPGMVYTIKVSILKSSAKVNVTAEIASETKSLIENTAVFSQGNTGNLDLKVPFNEAVSSENYYLTVNGSGGLEFSEKSYVRFRENGFSLNIQTDKGVYKPGQTVKMRIFGLLPDLKVFKGKVAVEVLDPNTNKMSHWADLEDPSGVTKKEFSLSNQPVMGMWKIQVTAMGQTYERTFEVKEYVLPKFKVSVTLPPYATKKGLEEDSLKGAIDVKYTYGKGVEGTANISLGFDRFKMIQLTRTKDLTVKGSSSFYFTKREIEDLFKQQYPWSQPQYLYSSRWYSLVVNATFEEKLTGRKASGESTISFFSSDVKLEFPSFNPNSFKPGLLFDAVLQVTQPDGSPLSPTRQQDMKVTIHRRFTYGEYESADAYTPKDGVIVIQIDVPSNATIVSLLAKYKDDINNKDEYGEQAYLNAEKALSPSSSYLQLQTSTPAVKAGEAIQLSLKSSFKLSYIVYLVLSRGNIRDMRSQSITGGATTATFSIASTHVMAPSAQVVVYTIRPEGEVVVDSLTVTVEKPFANEVSVSFSRDSAKPGDQVNLLATATPDSLVAFRVVDKSVLLMDKDNDITCNKVLSDIQGYSPSGGYPWWEWNWFVPGRRRRRMVMPFPVSGQDAKSVFENSGLLVLSNCLVYSVPSSDYPYLRKEFAMEGVGVPVSTDAAAGKQPLAEVSKVRTLFPETWVWSEVNASSSGQAAISTAVPDTITSWVASAFALSPTTGFGVACNPSKLQVMQPFFVSLDLPYSVIRGEEVAIKALVFNYLQQPQEVTITLKASKHWTIINELSPRGAPDQGEPKDTEYKMTVPANEGRAVSFPITPKTLGTIPIIVQAQSVSAADAVQRILIVEPEGVEQEYSYTVLVDLNQTSSFSKSIELAVPDTAVEGSATAKVTVVGDIMGSSFSNLDNLLRMPYGCGEQNMVNFAPNIFVLKYLTAVKQLTPAIRNKAEVFMIKGYQREQTYRHPEGSYSAFGERDKEGSMWLTAFVVKSFAQARKYIYIDEKALDQSIFWMVSKQSPSGAFPKVGTVHSSYLKGGLQSEIALTAFVVIALAEAKSQDKGAISAQANALRYLETNLQSVISKQDAYTLAICTYAMALTNSRSLSKARTALTGLATVKDGTMYWTDGKQDKLAGPSRPYYRPRSADIEITAYALLAIGHNKDVQTGLPVVRWLSQQRNSLGGYSSTQDTVVGIQAMSEFASFIYSPSMDYTVTLTNTDDNTFSKTFTVNAANSMILQEADITKVEGSL